MVLSVKSGNILQVISHEGQGRNAMEKLCNCNYLIQDFLKLVRRLRSSNDFKWDKLRNYISIRCNLISTAYEIIDAIDTQDDDAIKEKLGYILLQILYYCENEGDTYLNEIIDNISKRIISKYPYLADIEECSNNKCKIYNLRERDKRMYFKRDRTLIRDDIRRSSSTTLPALIKTSRFQEKAARLGYGLLSIEDALNETFERLHYLETLIIDGRRDYYNREIGELLFSIAEISRLLGIDAESSLNESCERFKNEFLYKLSLENTDKV